MVYIRRCVLCVSLAVLIPTQAFWSILKTGRGHSTELVDYDANTIADNLGNMAVDLLFSKTSGVNAC